MRVPTSLRVLRHRDYALLWGANLISNIGSWMQTVAVGALVTDITGQARWTGLVAAAAFLPIGVVAPIGGVLADRVDRKRLLVIALTLETFLAALLAVVFEAGRAGPGALAAIVLLQGAVVAGVLPAMQSLTPELVPQDDVLAAMSLSSASYNFGRIIGPVAAGLAISLGSYTVAFVANAVSFAVVVVALQIMRIPRRDAPAHTTLLEGIKDGARAARDEPGCRAAIGLIGITALLCSPFIALIPAVAQVLFGEGPKATSLLVTAQGVGAVAGALAIPGLALRHGRGRMLRANLTALPIALIAYALAPTLLIAALALVGVGAIYVGILSGLITLVQVQAPTAFRARILSLYMVSLGTIYPVGAVIHGVLADRFGQRQVTATTALLFLGITTALFAWRRDLRAALDDPLEMEAVPSAGDELVHEGGEL